MSRASILAAPGELAAARPYAERSERAPGWHDRLAEFLWDTGVRPLWTRLRDPARALRAIVPAVEAHERRLRAADDRALGELAASLRGRLRRQGFSVELAGECFALVREAAERTLGKRHYEPQLLAGWGLLQGRLIEMQTGEGKTFAATLAACAAALAGYPVHVITVNDYLAARDAEEMGPLYRFLGLTVGVVVQGRTRVERRSAYACSITYCSNKELAFDYLRDRVALARRASRLHLALERLRGDATREEDLVLRGLHFAIVDEADSVFIDEARTPLILSATSRSAAAPEDCTRALALARMLAAGEGYTVDLAERSVALTDSGKAQLAAQSAALEGVWRSVRAREELVTQALSALLLFRRDQHYVVADDKVQIVDESTGRVMPDRSWEQGLHQMIEAKEGCPTTDARETLARLTYQRLFRRYLRLSGMTGTAQEVAREIASVYRLRVVPVPLHRPSRRVYGGARFCETLAEKWAAVADAVERIACIARRPVLIGTRSVRASEELSRVLTERGIEHALLNAKQDKAEADVVARAGEPGRVTVATNLAGRGTDIRLAAGVAEAGGLHVILTEYHDSRRIDRQLFGRCARQGDPGSCEAIVSFEDEIFAVHAPRAALWAAALRQNDTGAARAVQGGLRATAQFSAERRAAAVRVQNLKLDQRLEQLLAFSGRGE
ncbi:MAG TPA: prepilin peptidase [Burkholderiales bacterium]|nr:prepilin peptidase [Burkholderiales bacterium]